MLQGAIHGATPIETNPFIVKYLSNFTLELEIAGGVTAQLKLTTDALTLALAEALQLLDRRPEAIQYIEQLNPTFPALLSLTELYSDLGNWEEVIHLTDLLTVDSDLTALLSILRAQAHLEMGQLVAAKECLAPAASGKKLAANIRYKALALRSNISLEEKAYPRAIADLEKILAEDSQVPGVREALATANEAKKVDERSKLASAAAKAAEMVRVRDEKAAEVIRLREEKAAEVIRVREEKAAEAARARADKAAEAARIRQEKADEAQRVRDEKAAAKLALKNIPVMQTGIINLSDDVAAEVSSPVVETPDVVVAVSTKEPGFYPDPEGVAPFRFWDGSAWTSRIRMTQ